MSLYNMLFGVNGAASMLLAVLGLDEVKVGRFRNAYVTPEREIAIYTRNGGGNRDCWHESSPEWGNEACGGESYVVEVDESVMVTEAEAKEKGYALTNIFAGNKRSAMTGRRVPETRHRCKQPDSAECSCPGCVIRHRLPAHPLYLRDEDDEFDCTYATIYFAFPPEYAAELTAMAEGAESIVPGEQWAALFAALEKRP